MLTVQSKLRVLALVNSNNTDPGRGHVDPHTLVPAETRQMCHVLYGSSTPHCSLVYRMKVNIKIAFFPHIDNLTRKTIY